MIQIPEYATYVINKIEEKGYEAYVVGGCVRDALLGKEPHDYDICTSAFPSEVIECFPEDKIVETGLKHGTVTIVLPMEEFGGGGGNYEVEVTTYRIDGGYSDGRHPDSVEFTRRLEEDLARRDFTINAMAYNPKLGLVDPYGGEADLTNRIIRCVGNPYERFSEDALRILRAIRFSATLTDKDGKAFAVDRDTALAIFELSPTVNKVSAERINVELSKMITGNFAAITIKFYRRALESALGFTIGDDDAIDTFRMIKGMHMRMVLFFSNDVENKMKALRFSNDQIAFCSAVSVACGEALPISRYELKKFIGRYGFTAALASIEINYARISTERNNSLKKDIRTYNSRTFVSEYMQRCEKLIRWEKDIRDKKECCFVKDLDINGRDLMDLGVQPGPKIGHMLEGLLDAVMLHKVENKKADLLQYAKDYLGAEN